jgi:hypothetical protein
MESIKLDSRINKKSTSIWVDKVEWNNFIFNSKKLGSSSCHIIDGFIFAFNRALDKSDVSKSIFPRINIESLDLHLHRNVQRYRRRSKRDMEEFDEREREEFLIKQSQMKKEVEAYKKHQKRAFWRSHKAIND